MTHTTKLLRGTALTALLGLGLSAPALAQEAEAEAQTEMQAQSEAPAGERIDMESQPDQPVASVNGTEILTGDVMRFVGALPEQMRQGQSPEMLISAAVQQLVMRQLILDEARAADLAEDERVLEIVEQTSQKAQDDAMVQVWLQDELADDVTDDQVQAAYDRLSANGTQELPPLEDVRPRIEQQLRQQAFLALRGDLQKDAEIVFFDASGEPLPEEGGETTGMGAEMDEQDDAADN